MPDGLSRLDAWRRLDTGLADEHARENDPEAARAEAEERGFQLTSRMRGVDQKLTKHCNAGNVAWSAEAGRSSRIAERGHQELQEMISDDRLVAWNSNSSRNQPTNALVIGTSCRRSPAEMAVPMGRGLLHEANQAWTWALVSFAFANFRSFSGMPFM